MSKRPYQHLPPLEHRPDGSPYRITPPQNETSQRPDTPGSAATGEDGTALRWTMAH